jgi:hypothetical protein
MVAARGARTSSANERIENAARLANEEALLAEAVEALREFNEEHPS